ncbi:hypothetical protein Tsubulata_017504 [Turnera subulata]|uniref:Uncharacterized protein n=1 Tax=Turnera subulata TaxID=218843 RepID=A0A9Q0J6X7_9ROSI|nr:hypothetical protein Tsubulata_017504 [Turnera subulata]
MEATAFSGSRGIPFIYSSPKRLKTALADNSASYSPLLIKCMATQKPSPSAAKTVSAKKNSTVTTSPPIKLLTRVEQLKLLTKAEKAGLLSAAEKAGLSLSSIEKLGLLSKAEELGVLSAATDPGTPGALFTLSLGLLLLGPACVYFVPEDYPWEVAIQVAVALLSVVGGSAAFAASSFVSNLQRSN